MNDFVINVLIEECGRYERTGIAVAGTLLVDKLYEIDAYPAADLKKDVEQDSEIRVIKFQQADFAMLPKSMEVSKTPFFEKSSKTYKKAQPAP